MRLNQSSESRLSDEAENVASIQSPRRLRGCCKTSGKSSRQQKECWRNPLLRAAAELRLLRVKMTQHSAGALQSERPLIRRHLICQTHCYEQARAAIGLGLKMQKDRYLKSNNSRYYASR